ncbi:MAG: rod shape-determining protein MreC [Candidatus Berkelbacteria bacterium]|nr:rod shape-determining protein MreC [Candidatus Berkelbacteria bacterium]
MKKRYTLIIVLFLVVFLIIIYGPVKNVFLIISNPFLNFFEKASVLIISKPADFFRTIKNVNNLASENQGLQRKINDLEAEKAGLKEKEKENEILKRQLNFVENTKGMNLLGANVIGRSPNNFSHYLIINRGEKDGLKIGQAVISEGLLLGKISEVNFNTSKVFLVTNPTGAVPALTQDSRAAGLIKGEIGYGLVLEDLPKDILIFEGENIITSGLGGEYPKGLLIGKLEKVISSTADVFQRASIKSLVDYGKLEIVFIITS